MTQDIVLPETAWEGVDAHTEALLDSWLVAPGSVVQAGMPVARVVLVKTSIEVMAPRSGQLVKVLVAAGETFRRGQPLGQMADA